METSQTWEHVHVNVNKREDWDALTIEDWDRLLGNKQKKSLQSSHRFIE